VEVIYAKSMMDGMQGWEIMLERRFVRRPPPGTIRPPAPKTDENMASLAMRMFGADGKNPYYRGEMVIRNLDELDRNIALFEQSEAGWVADWLEYLGDAQTARRIHDEPSGLGRIVHERAEQLRRNRR
jgi:hypothetical protein